MKIFTQLCLGLSLLCLMVSAPLNAQEKNLSEVKEIKKAKQLKEKVWMMKHHNDDVRSDRPLIGIYAGHHDQGVEVDNVVEGGGAGIAGLQSGDVITAINGTSLTNLHDLQRELSKYQGGQQVAVQYLRDGQSLQANVALKARPNIRADRPLIGIFPESNDGKGIRVDDIAAGGGAVEAGIKSGDIITQINGATVNSMTDLKAELSKYQAGDQVSVTYLSQGSSQQAMVTLQERKQRNRSNWSQKRDPCAVFIGVTLSGTGEDGRGVRVSGILDDTPAQISSVKEGDDIIALDDVFVNSFNELLHERNKHQPGDYFTLTVRREGVEIDIEAQFKTCEEEPMAKEEETEEIEEELEEPQQIVIDNTLKIEQYRAFPNPAFGNLNVQFQAEALPTVVSIVDASGKTMYRERLNRFDGFYNQRIDLSDFTPGNYYLQIRQDDKVITEKVVVLPRA